MSKGPNPPLAFPISQALAAEIGKEGLRALNPAWSFAVLGLFLVALYVYPDRLEDPKYNQMSLIAEINGCYFARGNMANQIYVKPNREIALGGETVEIIDIRRAKPGYRLKTKDKFSYDFEAKLFHTERNSIGVLYIQSPKLSFSIFESNGDAVLDYERRPC